MKRLPLILVIAALAGAAAIAYGPARASYARGAARKHVTEAEALLRATRSPIAQQSLKGAADDVRFALTRPDASIDEVRALDAALMSVMAEIKTSPPPEQPVYLTAAYERSAVAGVPFSVRLTLHSDVPQAFLVAVTCEFIVGGWKSGPSVRQVNQAIGRTPIDAEFAFTIPADVSGAGEVRASAAYRLNPTGEGQDFRASPKTPLPPVAVVRR